MIMQDEVVGTYQCNHDVGVVKRRRMDFDQNIVVRESRKSTLVIELERVQTT